MWDKRAIDQRDRGARLAGVRVKVNTVYRLVDRERTKQAVSRVNAGMTNERTRGTDLCAREQEANTMESEDEMYDKTRRSEGRWDHSCGEFCARTGKG